MEQRLGRNVECYEGSFVANAVVLALLRLVCGIAAELHPSETRCHGSECRRTDELAFAHHLAPYLLLFGLGLALHALGHGLRREAVLIYAVDGIMHEGEVLHDEKCVFWQKAEERNLCFGQ